MRRARETIVGGVVFASFLALAVALGVRSGNAALRVFAVLAGLWGGSAMGVFAGLATHLAIGPARYEPIEGEASAWGLTEFEDAGQQPPRRL
ncbi:MAG TPA: hypothetical protein VM370_05885 [Candidatus Thermoplasmatota archaeon]|nr:hypothetical protein [Candidatus Thermoplasmatota archaeon]